MNMSIPRHLEILNGQELEGRPQVNKFLGDSETRGLKTTLGEPGPPVAY